MDCRKAKQRLNENRPERDAELVQHLKGCPVCSREAAAAGRLQSILRQAREEEYHPTPIAALRTRIEASSAAQEKNIMAHLTNQFRHRPRLTFGVGLAIFAFLFVVLVPFPYTRTVGYNVVFNGVDPSFAAADNLESAFAALGFDDVRPVACDNRVTLLELPTRQAAMEAAAVFAAVTGSEATPVIERVTERVSGSLYAQVLERKKTIDVDAEGKSDAEIQEEITQKLAEAGYPGASVSVTTNADGEMNVSISMQKMDAGECGKEEVRIDLHDADRVEFLLPAEVKVDCEGKTDAEIISEVKSQLAEQGVEAEVTVTTEPDGKKKIEVRKTEER